MKGAPLWLQADGDMAGVALYAALFESDVARLGQAPVDGGMTRTRLAERRQRRLQALNVLVAACANSGDLRGAYDAVTELCALAPDDPLTLKKRAAIEQMLGADGTG